MAKKITMNDIMKEMDRMAERFVRIETSLNRVENTLASREPVEPKKFNKKAKELPLGTKVSILGCGNERVEDDIYYVIGHSRTCDQVIVIENDSGDITTENVNDLEVLEA